MKREPLLYDQVLTRLLEKEARWLYPDSLLQMIYDQMLVAKKFVLDAKASEFLGSFMAEAPQAIVAAQEFAIPPFHTMWVEMNAHVIFETVNSRPPSRNSDTVFGYLFVGPEVYSFARSIAYREQATREQVTLMVPLKYRLNKLMTLEEENALADFLSVSRAQLDSFFWGSPSKELFEQVLKKGTKIDDDRIEIPYEEWSTSTWHALRAHHAAEVLPFSKRLGEQQRTSLGSGLYEGAAGDLRNVVSTLIFLNRTSKTQVVREVESARGIINRQSRPYAAHSVISFVLNPVPALRRIGAEGTGTPKRLHDVRGHFAHNAAGRATDCLHQWVEHVGSRHRAADGSVLTWRCTNCSGLRWWKPEHKRGKMQGIVVSEYAVTAKEHSHA